MGLFDETVEELIKLLSSDNQNWLFGAGISVEANIPLMITLTKRVEKQLSDNFKILYQIIADDLLDNYHIEHVLSHIGDLLALSQRSRYCCVELKGNTYTKDDLLSLHTELVRQIGKTIRYGYKEEDITKGIPERVGTIDQPIAQIQNHREFVKALLSSKANLFTRSSISIFTTNYDTLMEDALALEKLSVNDGFSGAAIGFWNPDVSFNNISGVNMIKLHGSVDWIKDPTIGLIRNRYGVDYLGASEDVLIYPQATKYVETQKDPFALLFTKFRERLNSPSENLAICAGYSFGDQHINSEIDIALKATKNKTTLVVFINNLNEVLTDG
ncbi:MAG: SIR2 family protein [Bacillota bacterium]|nr:SIR2 family protein [Bacillota bacterium]